MKRVAWSLCLLATCLVSACVYDAPFVEEAALPIDLNLVGTWQEMVATGKAEDPKARLVVLPFSRNEYMVVSAPGDDAAYFRAFPVLIGDDQFVQIEWLGAQDGRFQLCRTGLSDGVLSVETLNDQFVSARLKDSASLRQALLANRSESALFIDKVCYRRLNQ